MDYMLVDSIQRKIHAQVSALEVPDTFIIWEAQDVYTAGRKTKPEDIPDTNVPVITMDRGGSVTYHGPGQLVVYPVIKVAPPKDVVTFVRNTETAVINAMREYQLETAQVEGRSGVWILKDGEQDKKLCAIGIKFAADTSLHGLALNVSTNLERFMRVIPCGLSDAGVATLREQGIETSLDDVAARLLPHLAKAYAPLRLRTESSDGTDISYVSGDTSFPQLDPEEYIREAHNSSHRAELPPKTGVPWTQVGTKGTSASA
ncbi:lipoyl(octanoyl) transferase LipB [Arcanobacterium bovis]|nr:lipoyl(octanoyl) transferase LipB [Arcanobacterium bovis]